MATRISRAWVWWVAVSLLLAQATLLPSSGATSFDDGRAFSRVLEGQVAFDDGFAYWAEYAFDGVEGGHWPKLKYQVRQRSLSSGQSRVLYSSTTNTIVELHANAGRVGFSTSQEADARTQGHVQRYRLYAMGRDDLLPKLLSVGSISYPTPKAKRAVGDCGALVSARDVADNGDLIAAETHYDCHGDGKTELTRYSPSGVRSANLPFPDSDQVKSRHGRLLGWGEYADGARLVDEVNGTASTFRAGEWISEMPTQGDRIAAITSPEVGGRQELIRFAPGTLHPVQRIRLAKNQVGTLRFCDSGGFVVITGQRHRRTTTANFHQILGRGPFKVRKFDDTGTPRSFSSVATHGVEGVTCTADQVIFVVAGKRRPKLVRLNLN